MGHRKFTRRKEDVGECFQSCGDQKWFPERNHGDAADVRLVGNYGVRWVTMAVCITRYGIGVFGNYSGEMEFRFAFFWHL